MTRQMKDSGVEWIGEIPEDWSVLRIKNVAKLYNGNSISDDEKAKYEDSENAIPYIATKDIDSLHKIDYTNGMYVKTDQLQNFKVALENSVLMCIEGGSAGIKKARLNQDVCFVNKLCCFTPNRINGNYLYYFLNSPNFEDHFKSKLSGLISGVSISELKTMNCVFPSLSEQKKIASFLDDKCNAIDEIIAKTEQSIEEYKKLKQSVITEAVTKGIRPNRKMKDSGIAWIGEIPEDWQIAKLKKISLLITDGAHVSPETENGVYDFVSTVDVKQDNIDFENCLKTSIESYNKLVKNKCKPKIGDILISKDGTVGKTVVVNYEREFIVASSLVIIRLFNVYNQYFINYVLKSNIVQEQLNMFMKGAGLKRVSVENNKKLNVVIPSKEEQKEIADYLDKKCAGIDDLIEKKQQFLTELATYKKSLIYEYVTGKKEVV